MAIGCAPTPSLRSKAKVPALTTLPAEAKRKLLLPLRRHAADHGVRAATAPAAAAPAHCQSQGCFGSSVENTVLNPVLVPRSSRVPTRPDQGCKQAPAREGRCPRQHSVQACSSASACSCCRQGRLLLPAGPASSSRQPHPSVFADHPMVAGWDLSTCQRPRQRGRTHLSQRPCRGEARSELKSRQCHCTSMRGCPPSKRKPTSWW